MALTEEQRRNKILSDAAATQQRGAIASSALGHPSGFSAGIPTPSPFPITGLSSFQPQRSPSIPISGGGTANFGLGSASMNFPYSYGTMAKTPQQFASGLPQASVAPSDLFSGQFVSQNFAERAGRLQPLQSSPMLNQMYSNPFSTPSQRMGENLSLGLTPTAQPTSMGIEGGPVSLRGATAMTAPQTAVQSGRQAIKTPYGTIYATPQQQQNLGARTTAYEGRPWEQQQALLSQMRSTGYDIKQREEERQKNKYYAWRQQIEEQNAQKALSTEGNRLPDVQRGANAQLEAKRWKLAQSGRNPMSNEPISMGGLQFQRGSMGQYSPIKNVTTPNGFAQPSQISPSSSPSLASTIPSATGSIASGSLSPFYGYPQYSSNIGSAFNQLNKVGLNVSSGQYYPMAGF